MIVGPFVYHRVIDLGHGAASDLGFDRLWNCPSQA